MNTPPPPSIDLDTLHKFVVFCDTLNLTHAARAVHLSQPALHTRLQKLSKDLGVTLYTRVGKHLHLTPDGLRVAHYARTMLARTDTLLTALRDDTSPVALVAGEGAYLYLLSDALHTFRSTHSTPLRLLTRRGGDILETVAMARANLGVTVRPSLSSLQHHQLSFSPIAHIAQHLILPVDHPFATRSELAPHHLRDLPLIVAPPNAPQRRAIRDLLHAHNIPWTAAVEATGWPLVLRFVSLGLGFAVVNSFCHPPEGFVSVPIPALPTHTYGVITRTDDPLQGACAALSQTIQNHVASIWLARTNL